MIAANRKVDDLGALHKLAVHTSAWRLFVLDMISRHRTTTYATASAWIAFATDGLEDQGDNSDATKFKAATAWHITAIRDAENRGHDQAEAILASLEKDPNTASQVNFTRSVFAMERGDFEEAAQINRQILNEQPDNVPSLNNLAMALVNMNRSKEALSYAERATTALPIAATLDTLALAQLGVGQVDEAELTIGRAIELEPKNLDWLITRCRILMAKDEPTAVKQALQTYEKINDIIAATDQVSESLSPKIKSLQSEMDQLLPAHQNQR